MIRPARACRDASTRGPWATRRSAWRMVASWSSADAQANRSSASCSAAATIRGAHRCREHEARGAARAACQIMRLRSASSAAAACAAAQRAQPRPRIVRGRQFGQRRLPVRSPCQAPSAPLRVVYLAAASERLLGRALPSANSCSACMRLSVSVPVLSVQMVLTGRNVSTEGSAAPARSAPPCGARRAQRHRHHRGRRFGNRRHRRLTAVSTISTGGSRCAARRWRRSSTRIASTTSAGRLPKQRPGAAAGRLRFAAAVEQMTTLPSSVAMPVTTTRPVPRPCAAVVPLKAMLSQSPSAAPASEGNERTCLSTATDSPVSADSSMRSCCDQSSAWVGRHPGLPASGNTMSPAQAAGGNRHAPAAAHRWRVPPRAAGAARGRSRAPGLQKPISALSSTITTMASVSTGSPIGPDTTAAEQHQDRGVLELVEQQGNRRAALARGDLVGPMLHRAQLASASAARVRVDAVLARRVRTHRANASACVSRRHGPILGSSGPPRASMPRPPSRPRLRRGDRRLAAPGQRRRDGLAQPARQRLQGAATRSTQTAQRIRRRAGLPARRRVAQVPGSPSSARRRPPCRG